MPPAPPLTTLRRMAGAQPPPEEGAADGASPALERAMRLGAQRLGDELPGLGLQSGSCASTRSDADAAFADIDERALVLLLDPPGPADPARMSPDARAGLSGALILSPVLVDGLVEAQTIGSVDGPGRDARRPTRIDAALCQPFARALAVHCADKLSGAGVGGVWPGPLRTGSYAVGTAGLGSVLTAPRYLRLDLTITLAHGARTGPIHLLLSLDGAEETAEAVQTPATLPKAAKAAPVDPATLLRAAPVRLEATFPALRMTLGDLLALRVGQTLPLPDGALSDLVLRGGTCVAPPPGRARVAPILSGRLGQLNGARAIKLQRLPGQPDAGKRAGAALTDALAPDDGALTDGPALPTADGAPGVAQAPQHDTAMALDLPDLPDLPELPDLP